MIIELLLLLLLHREPLAGGSPLYISMLVLLFVLVLTFVLIRQELGGVRASKLECVDSTRVWCLLFVLVLTGAYFLY